MLAEAASSLGVTLHRAPFYHRLHSEHEQRNAIRDVLHRSAPDIVHFACATPWSCIVAREVVLELGFPLIFTEQYVARGSYIDEAIKDRVTRLYEMAACVICVCHENRTLLSDEYGLPAKNAIIIPNAVCVPVSRPARVKRGGLPLRAITVARLVHQKGLDILLLAVASLPRELKERFSLAVVGDGPLLEEMKTLRSRLDITGQVQFFGWRQDISDLLPEFDLFILASRSEGQPFALLEAMAAGIPVIASAVSGIPEALEHGNSGILVPPEDPYRLAQAVAWFASNPANAEIMAFRAFDFIRQHHDIQKAIAQHVELWWHTLKIRRAPKTKQQ